MTPKNQKISRKQLILKSCGVIYAIKCASRLFLYYQVKEKALKSGGASLASPLKMTVMKWQTRSKECLFRVGLLVYFKFGELK